MERAGYLQIAQICWKGGRTGQGGGRGGDAKAQEFPPNGWQVMA